MYEKIETVIKYYENCICPFHYERKALAEALKVGCGTLELCGMQCEYHCYNASRSLSDHIRRNTVDRWASAPCGSLQRRTTRNVKNLCMTVLISWSVPTCLSTKKNVKVFGQIWCKGIYSWYELKISNLTKKLFWLAK